MKKRIAAVLIVLSALLLMTGCSGGGGGNGGGSGSDAKAITAFALYTDATSSSPFAIGTIDESAKTIAVTIPYGMSKASLVAGYITTGSKVSVNGIDQVSGTTSNNFTGPQAYVITAENGTTATYTVTVTNAAIDAKAITAFALITGASGTLPDAIGVIDTIASTITVTVPFGTNVTNLIATFITTGVSVSAQGQTQISGSTRVDFTSPVVYRVTAGDLSTADYTVRVWIAPISAKAITAYSILGILGTINQTIKTIEVTVPFGTDVTNLVATFATTGSSVTVGGTLQVSGVTPNNFTNPVVYLVHASDNSPPAAYTVSVTVALNTAKAITSFALATGAAGTVPDAPGTISESAKTIAVTVPYGTNVTALVATYVTTGAYVSVGGTTQVSGSTPNNFTGSVPYLVHAADGSTAMYTVTVTIAPQGNAVINLPKTGQTVSYAAGDDGDLQLGVAWPSTRFEAVSVGSGTIITDNLTGLMWNVESSTNVVTWLEALTYVSSLNTGTHLGYTDWRLPSINELESLLSAGIMTNNLKLQAQGFGVMGAWYWSSTSDAADTANSAWLLYLEAQDAIWVQSGGKTISFSQAIPVRTVPGVYTTAPAVVSRTGQTVSLAAGDDGALQSGVPLPNPRFTANADTSIRDNLTGLNWAPSGNLMTSLSPTFDHDAANDGKVTWQHALDYVALLNTQNYLGHNDWRLPNMKEMRSPVDYGQSNLIAYFQSGGFSDVQADIYWTSSTGSDGGARTVEMMRGGYLTGTKSTDHNFVWPVR